MINSSKSKDIFKQSIVEHFHTMECDLQSLALALALSLLIYSAGAQLTSVSVLAQQPDQQWANAGIRPIRVANRLYNDNNNQQQQQQQISGHVDGRAIENFPTRNQNPINNGPIKTMQANQRGFNNNNYNNAPTLRPARNWHNDKIVCYYASYAATRFGRGRLPVDDIEPNLCTHIIYGSLGLNSTDEIESANPEIDLADYDGLDSINKLSKLKLTNPALKTLVSVGSSEVGAAKFSSMASRPDARFRFIRSVLVLLDQFKLDGIDINWQFPGSKDGGPNDKENFVTLLRELKSGLAPRGYLLTAQLAGQKPIMDAGYNIPQLVKYLDLINLIAYDYQEVHDNRTGLLAPINMIKRYNDSRDIVANINWSVYYWIMMGARAHRIALGIAFYGQTYMLNNVQQNGVNAPANELGEPGSHTSVAGVLGYNEICVKLIHDTDGGNKSNWSLVLDRESQLPYAYKQNEWISFDDWRSVARKTQYAKQRGLGGVFLFSLDTDDFSGACHNVKYPLAKSAKWAMANG